MTGDEVSVELISIDNNYRVIAITDKVTSGSPHFVEISHSQPTKLTEIVKEDVIRVAKSAARAVGIENGAAHIEIMITEKGPKLVELGHRLGGDFITSHLVPLSTGIDMIKASLLISCGIFPEIPAPLNMASAVMFIFSEPGTISEIRGLRDAELVGGVQEIVLLKSVGSEIHSLENSLDRVGAIIVKSKTASEAINIAKTTAEHIVVVTN